MDFIFDTDIIINHSFNYNSATYKIDYIDPLAIRNKLFKTSLDSLARGREIPVIVSLTSYPPRIPLLYCTLYSLSRQTARPRRIVLWLATDEFPQRERELPESLLCFRRCGLEIRWCRNTRSFKKLIYALKEFQNDIVVTCDDDVIYSRIWLESLYNEHLLHPADICTHRARLFSFKNYNRWKISETTRGSFLNFFTGVGGVLYPRGVFRDNRTFFDEKLMMELCPTADDVWFWAMAVLSGIRIRLVEGNLSTPVYIDPKSELRLGCKQTLAAENCENNANDRYLEKILKRFPIIKRRVLIAILRIKLQKLFFQIESHKKSFRIWLLGIPVFSRKEKRGQIISRFLIIKIRKPVRQRSPQPQ